MTTTQSCRRDPRYSVRPESAAVEFEYPGVGSVHGWLSRISLSGLAFVMDDPGIAPAPGMRLCGVRITIGDCRIEGDVVVRHAGASDAPGLEIGGLFNPASNRDLQTLMVLISALSCA